MEPEQPLELPWLVGVHHGQNGDRLARIALHQRQGFGRKGLGATVIGWTVAI